MASFKISEEMKEEENGQSKALSCHRLILGEKEAYDSFAEAEQKMKEFLEEELDSEDIKHQRKGEVKTKDRKLFGVGPKIHLVFRIERVNQDESTHQTGWKDKGSL